MMKTNREACLGAGLLGGEVCLAAGRLASSSLMPLVQLELAWLQVVHVRCHFPLLQGRKPPQHSPVSVPARVQKWYQMLLTLWLLLPAWLQV